MQRDEERYRWDRRDRYEVEDAASTQRPDNETSAGAGPEGQVRHFSYLARLYVSGRRDRYEQDDVGARPAAHEQEPASRAGSRRLGGSGSADREENPHPRSFMGA